MKRLALAILVPLLTLTVTTAANAATPSQVAGNLKDELLKIAAAVYIGIIAIVSIKFLGKREFSQLGIFLCVAIVVGCIVFAPAATTSFVKSSANTLL